MRKESITGYMDRSLEGGKLENLIYCQVGSVYYLPKFGIDRTLFMDSSYPIQNKSFESYMRQVAMMNQILTSDISVKIENFTANINYVIANESSQIGAFSEGSINV